MQKYNGQLETKFWWIIPLLIGVSKNKITPRGVVYGVHILLIFVVGFAWRTKE
jgi:hypothetical protein